MSKKKKQTFRATEREEREREEKKRWNYRKKQRGRDMIRRRENHIYMHLPQRESLEKGARGEKGGQRIARAPPLAQVGANQSSLSVRRVASEGYHPLSLLPLQP